MFLHENERCPVCDKLFTPDDDIVICHRCGTPHHRECYNTLGHCANADKHGEGFSYQASASADGSEHAPEHKSSFEGAYNPNNEHYQPKQSTDNGSKTHCKDCGKEIDKSAPFCLYCGARQDFPDYRKAQPLNSPFAPQNTFEDTGEKIDGKSVKDIADTVRSNSFRFIDKFRKNKKVSWNWGGFFFGAYYLFYRKMYKEGVIALAINLIATLLVNGFYVEQISTYSQAVYSYYSAAMSQGTQQMTIEKIQAYAAELEPVFMNILPALIIMLAVRFAISIIIAMFADRMYKFKVMSIIDTVNQRLEQGDSFASIGMLQSEMSISQEQMKTLYLGKTGGISLFAPLIAYGALNIITSIIERL